MLLGQLAIDMTGRRPRKAVQICISGSRSAIFNVNAHRLIEEICIVIESLLHYQGARTVYIYEM